jgi:DNA-binding response OmpR family regulator
MSRAPRVLVVEDEQDIAGLIKHALERSGDAQVEIVGSGDAALRAVTDNTPDLVILDLNLPVLSGTEVCRILRGRPATANVPIIMLTARVDESDRIIGLEIGADDYITKPFSPRELVARVKAVLRRATAGAADGDLLRRSDLTIDVGRLKVTRGTTSVDLTPAEFQLLLALARQPGRILTRTQLLRAIGGESSDVFDRAIDTHVKNIRRKLEPDPREPQYILTVYGVGYKFRDE